MSDHIPERNPELDSAHPTQPVSEIDNNPTPAHSEANEGDDPRPADKKLHNGTLLGIGVFHGLLFVFWVLPASSYAAYKAADLIINGRSIGDHRTKTTCSSPALPRSSTSSWSSPCFRHTAGSKPGESRPQSMAPSSETAL